MCTTAPDLRDRLRDSFRFTRARTEALAAPLSPEDQQLQSMPDCSPTKWHRAHTTWFFETFVLAPHGIGPVHPAWGYLFNSYYEAVGPRHARPRRGMLSRPTVAEIAAWRAEVDARVLSLLGRLDDDALRALQPILELGLAHEEQHQELLLTDILHALSGNPLQPAYRAQTEAPSAEAAPRAAVPSPLTWVEHPGGLCWIGADPGGPFQFDNEGPRHRVWLEPFSLSDRLVTIGEMKAFIDARGYETPSLWLSAGIDFVRTNQINAPAYTRYEDGVYEVFGLDGPRAAHDDEPVAHLSYFEADALCRFLGGRLPTEAEWEVVASAQLPEGNLYGAALRPLPASPGAGARQLYGDVWEWTSSAYSAYPGYNPGPGALGEYNGKFMANQMVLRGGSCFTPEGHVRPTYRNFWPANTRFQMTGARLARDGGAR